ncbi:sigma-54 dependent transcriptional regulator [Desulfosporosinus sp. PR]|uniref:sigma-54-dependent transcriptional regulator n=1 Tax=Candidatus Desulfosporosinus nitrosoreducens TaxID=3401928 RepID=UPI0027F0DDA6|nr:sigma-54 dependent transcriptional regulator [Desulfosporosinus sp. PR]MDQ7095178.1 sigma-54 dependent transcriptional regulator [Desulfosporosinus sp. PR]
MAEVKGSILVADDEESVRNLIRRVLTKMDYAVETACNGEEVLAQIKKQAFDLLIMDIRMPKLDGMEAFKALRIDYPSLPIIMITAYSTVETTLETMRLGAFDYLTKPFDVSEVKMAVEKVFSSCLENADLQDAPVKAPNRHIKAFVGSSPLMQEVFKTIGRVSASDSSVLVQGESGTGKELVARTIHQYSNRKNKPFVTVNCGAIPEGILESEFFGHEKGAFTGAHQQKIGKLELADGGTIFLDEIGEMSPSLQVKLLRALQEREFERVGGNEKIVVDVRIIAATNKNLRQSIQDKSFRADLFYRLNVVSILIPPLRERKEDIPLLAAYFRDKFCGKLGIEPKTISKEVLNVLQAYDWPGNVRELENMLEHALVMSKGRVILVEDLPEEVLSSQKAYGTETGTKQETLRSMVKSLEKEVIAQTLQKTGGNKLQTAKLLDISRRALQYKIEEYGLENRENSYEQE